MPIKLITSTTKTKDIVPKTTKINSQLTDTSRQIQQHTTMSSSNIEMSVLAYRPSTPSNNTTTNMSRAPSFTHPLTRVQARSTVPSPPRHPSINPVGEEAANLAHGKVKDTFQLDYLPNNSASLASWADIPRLRLPTGVDPDEDGEDQDSLENWDLDLITLAVCTVDSVELIRRNTAEKKLRVGSCTSRSSKIVISNAVRSVKRIMRNGVMALFRRFSS